MSLAYASILDLMIVAVLVLSIVIGVRRGLIRSVIGLAGSVIALILALCFSSALGGYIDKNYVNTPMREWLISQLPPVADDSTASDVDFDDLFANRPEYLREICDFLNVDLDEVEEKYESDKASLGIDQAKGAIVTYMVDPLSSVISRVIAFAVIYLAAIIAVTVISLFSRFLNRLPIIRRLDKLGGALFGTLTGVLLCFVLVAIVSVGAKYVLRDRSASELNSIREHTVVYRLFRSVDPLSRLFESAAN